MASPAAGTRRAAAVLACLSLLLAGCAPFIDQVQPSSDPALGVSLTPAQSVGQTFVAERGGLNGIEFGRKFGSNCLPVPKLKHPCMRRKPLESSTI